MANLQSQIDILAKAIVNEHVRVDNSVVSITNGSENTFDLNYIIERADGDPNPPTIQGYMTNGIILRYENDGSRVGHVTYKDECVGLYDPKIYNNGDSNYSLMAIYDPDNSFDLVGLSVENLNEGKNPETGNPEITKNEYFIDVNGKITKVNPANKKRTIEDGIKLIDSAFGATSTLDQEEKDKINTHVNITKDKSGNKQYVFAINRIGVTQNCHQNNILIEEVTKFTIENSSKFKPDESEGTN